MGRSTKLNLALLVVLGVFHAAESRVAMAAEPVVLESCVACWTSPDCPTQEQRSEGCHQACNAWGYGFCLGELSGCDGDDNGWGCFNA